MAMVRLAPLLALVLTLAPACGHKGPPLPPRLHTPPTLGDFRLAQRGDHLEMSVSAPGASVDGVAFERVDVELFWGEGWVDLEKEGQTRTVRAEPGARVVESAPLPEPGTIVRAAARAVSGRDKGQRSLILALETHSPVAPPHELTARLRGSGVMLNWRGARPDELPPPDLSPIAGGPAPLGLDLDVPPSDDLGPSESPAAEGPSATPIEVVPPDPAPDGPPAPESTPPGEADAAGQTTTGEEEGDPAAAEEGDSAASEGDEKAPEPPKPRTYGFRVYRRLADRPFSVPLNHEPQERRLFSDTAAPLGSQVCYVVRAVGLTEPLIESAASNEICLEVRDILPPAPPTGLAVVPRGAGLEVVWSPSSEADLGGYRIYRAASGAEPKQAGEVPAGTTAWIDETPRSGVLYQYTVTAFDSAGNEGAPSGTAQGRGP